MVRIIKIALIRFTTSVLAFWIGTAAKTMGHDWID